MSELRQRPLQQQQPPPSSPSNEETENQEKKRRIRTIDDDDDDDTSIISLLDILRVIVTLVLASSGLSYYMTSGESLIWGYQRPWFTRWPVVMQYFNGPINLTPTQLSLYNGTDPSLPIYLAINGTIFDVSANRAIYGPGGGYNFFTGKDATRAFVTGCFQEDLTSDLDGVEEMYIPVDGDDDEEEEENLTSRERKLRREREVREAKAKVRAQVEHWEGFFRNHKKYFEVGRVIVDDDDDASSESQSGSKSKSKSKPKTKKPLCEAARKNRPKRKDLKKGNK